MVAVPPPDRAVEPEGFVVVLGSDRLHFLDWGGRASPGVVLVHGLGSTAWSWAPVARRLAASARVVALDLRGHGLSDAPTEGYDPDGLADDVVAVAEGAGLLDDGATPVLAGHGFGGVVAAWAAARLGERCAGLALVDGGWTDLAATTGMEPAEWLRAIEEPPEVLRSMASYLADRRGWDPASWDADQERAARAAVVEVPAGHVVPVTRPHALAGSVGALFAYRPEIVLASVEAPIVALRSGTDEEPPSGSLAAAPGSLAAVQGALAAAQGALAAAGRPPIRVVDLAPAGHNLMRYRPDAVAAAILGLVAATMRP